MEVELEMVWDGNVSGLREHRLSLEAFGSALLELRAAIRRIASDLEMQARGPSGGRSRGRLAREASNLDVQISSVSGNSPLTVTTALIPVSQPAYPLINDLPDRTLDVFLQDMEREVRSMPSHHKIRRFLQVLPPGLTQQTYIHRSADGSIRRRVTFGEMSIVEPRSAPHLLELTGVLIGIGFDPGRSEVRVRADTGDILRLSATADQVDAALRLRFAPIRVLAVTDGQGTRLLRLANDVTTLKEPHERMDYIFSTWRELLHRLAQ